MDLTKALENQQEISPQAVNVKRGAGILGFFSSTQRTNGRQPLVDDGKIRFDLLHKHNDKIAESIASDKTLAHSENGNCMNKGAQNKAARNSDRAKIKEQGIKKNTGMALKKGNSAVITVADIEESIVDNGREAQEIDYVVFLRSLTQDSVSNSSENQQLSHSQVIANVAPTNITLPKNTFKQPKISEKIKSATPVSTFNTSSVSDCVAKCQGQSPPEEMKSKSTNAFIMLMQAKVQKQDVKSSEACILGKAHENKTEVEFVLDDDKEENVRLSLTPPSVPSIANFFTKCHKTVDTKSKGSTPLVVKVDIHSDPSSHKKDQVKQKTSNICSRNARKVVSTSFISDNDIVFLGSEIIEAEESESNKSKSSKTKQTSRATHKCSEHFISPTILDQNVNSQENKTDQVANKKTPRSIKASPKIDKDMSEKSMKKTEFLHHSTLHPDTGVKKAQAVLNFGRNGNLEANMPVRIEDTKLQQTAALMKDSAFKNDSACLLTNANKSKGSGGEKNSTRKKRTRAIESDYSDSELCSQNKTRRKRSCSSKISLRVRSPRLSKSFGSDSGNSLKDFTPSSKSKSSKFNNSTKATAKALVQKARLLQKSKTSPTYCGATRAMKNQTSPRRKLLSQLSAKTPQTASSTPAVKEKQTPKRIQISPSSLRNPSRTPLSANPASRRLIKLRTPITMKSASNSTPVMAPSRLFLRGGKTQGADVLTDQNSASIMTSMMTPLRVQFQGGKKAATVTSSQQQPERVSVNQKESSQKFLGTPSRVLVKEKMTATPAMRVKQACHSSTKPLPQTPLPSNDCAIVEAEFSSESKPITPDPERVPVNQKESSQQFLGTPSRVLLKEKLTATPAGRVKQACHSSTKPLPQMPLSSNDCVIVEAQFSSESKPITPDPGVGQRRSSRRLAEQQKLKKEMAYEYKEDCISIESDESDNEGPKKRKFKKRGPESHQTPQLTGKLAPIFIKKKDVDTATRCPPPAEDPELVKKRREFLMSGVPMELKRQTAASAQPVSASDFTPFPVFNHVQQKEVIGNADLSVWSLPVPEKMNPLLREISSEAALGNLLWNSLQWKPTPLVDSARKYGTLHTAVPFETIHSDMYTLLLKELPVAETDISFSALYDKFRTLSGKAADNGKPAERTSTDSDLLIVDDELDVMGDKGQWPEVLQPWSASEIMGNNNTIRRLKSWLEEWKDLIQREARLSAQTASSRPGSNFDFSDSDSQGSQLCNTMLLVGPHGVGKTAAVYALANQLSFKVFEVNASSSRQGRLLLSQLQEATQSHQVAQKKDGLAVQLLTSSAFGLESLPTEKSETKTVHRGSSSMVPTTFAKFFQKPSTGFMQNPNEHDLKKIKESKSDKNFDSPGRGNGNLMAATWPGRVEDSDEEIYIVDSNKRAKNSAQKSEGVRKVHRKNNVKKEKSLCLEKEIEESNLAGCLNLSSTSLILFDEVDLVFEEDSGFLQAVQHFITTTKIPIVMTTSDPGFQHCINARFETLQFQPPLLDTMVGGLQAAALAGGMRTSFSDMCTLARQCKDLRRALLSLQFLAQSGGGNTTQSRPLTLQPVTYLADAKKTQDVRGEGRLQEQQSEGEFSCLKWRRKKARRILDEDDDSNGVKDTTTRSLFGECRKDCDEGSTACNVAQLMDAGSADSAAVLPVVHLHLAESLMGVQAEFNGLFSRCLKDNLDICMLSQLSEECQKLQIDPLRVCNLNLLHLLPLTKTTMPPRWFPPCKSESVKSVKRKRIKSDIFDSDRSDDETINKGASEPMRDLVMPKLSEQEASSTHHEGNRLLSAAEGQQPLETSWLDDGKMALAVKNECELKTERIAEGQIVSFSIAEVESCGTRIKADHQPHLQNAALSTQHAEEEDISVVEAGVSEQTHCGREPTPSPFARLDGQILGSFARYWETLSAADHTTYRPGSRQTFTTAERWHLLPGIDDVAPQESEAEDSLKKELRSFLGVMASREMWQSVHSQVASWQEDNHSHCDKGLPHSCSIPMFDLDHSAGTAQWTALEESVPSDYRSAANGVMDGLPLVSCGSIDHVTLDYLPALRSICLAEHCRKVAKTKRRFHHHFDSIGLSIADSTISALCKEYPARAPNCLPS